MARPDFSVKSLRINAVLRWESHPGFTGHFVWTRLGQDLSRRGVFDVGDSIGHQPEDERAIDLQDVDWEAVQVLQRRVAGASPP